VLAFSLAHSGFGPKRISAELTREKRGGLWMSANGVWRVPWRHGLGTRRRQLGLIAGYAAVYERKPPQPEPERHVDAERPSEIVGLDCFYVGRLSGTKGQSGSTSTSPALPGPSCTQARGTRSPSTARASSNASPASSLRPAGGSRP
jgi:hypothetical protein